MAKKALTNKLPKWPFWTAWLIYLVVTMYLGMSGLPLSVGTVIALVFAFAFATILVVLPYWYEDRIRLKELALLEARCSDNISLALKKSEGLLDRVNELSSDASKSILVARQVPDRIQEKIALLQQIVERQEIKDFDKLMPLIDAIQKINYDRFDKFSVSLDELVAKMEEAARGDLTPSTRFASDESLLDVADKLSAKMQHSLSSLIFEQKEAIDLSLLENREVFISELEKLIQPSDSIVEDSTSNKASKGKTKKTKKVPEENLELLMDFAFESKEVNDAERVEKEFQSVDIEEDIEESEALNPIDDVEELEPEFMENDSAQSVEENQADLFSSHGAELLSGGIAPVGAKSERKVGDASLTVMSKIPLNEVLYIRGDEPYLSWDKGIEMSMIAIDTWKFTLKDIKEAVDCSVFLADSVESSEGDFTLHPGETLELKLHFEDAPF